MVPSIAATPAKAAAMMDSGFIEVPPSVWVLFYYDTLLLAN